MRDFLCTKTMKFKEPELTIIFNSYHEEVLF